MATGHHPSRRKLRVIDDLSQNGYGGGGGGGQTPAWSRVPGFGKVRRSLRNNQRGRPVEDASVHTEARVKNGQDT